MSKKAKKSSSKRASRKLARHAEAQTIPDYDAVLSRIVEHMEAERSSAVRTVNSIMTATYWVVGRQIVEYDHRGKERAGYGGQLLKRLAEDLTSRFGRGFSERNLEQMRLL